MKSGFVLWFTGLSGAGKSTLAAMASERLRERGVHVECLDGDDVRKHLSYGLGFSPEDRNRNVRRIGYVARLIARSGGCSITAAISPYRAIRDEIRSQCEGRFVEVYCECPLEALKKRDPKGLYAKAIAGEIKNFTGVDAPYEAPEHPEVRLDTDRESPEESLQKILDFLERRGFLDPEGLEAEALPAPHGGVLVEPLRAEMAPAADTPRLRLSAAEEALVHDFATGLLSPLAGFMTSRDCLKVVGERRLETGVPWPVPIQLDITSRLDTPLADTLIRLEGTSGQTVAQLHLREVWTQGGRKFAGGELQFPRKTSAAQEHDGPGALRQRFREAGQMRIAALWANTIPMRAFEPIIRQALSSYDALVVLVPRGDARRVHAWRWVFETFFSAERCVVVEAPALVSGRDEAAGRVAAIVAKNLGARELFVLGECPGLDLTGLGMHMRQFSDLGFCPRSEAYTWSTCSPQELVEARPSLDVGAPLDDLPDGAVRPEVVALLTDSSTRRQSVEAGASEFGESRTESLDASGT